MLLGVFRRDYELITLQNKLFAGKLCMHSRIITEARLASVQNLTIASRTKSFTEF